jgi:NTE family protein
MKRALVMSGGGAKGSFQAGVLDVLINQKGLDWDYISGVSVGALNAAMIGQAPPGKMPSQFQKLLNLWMNSITGNSSVWNGWPIIGMAAGLWKSSFYDSSPLVKLVQQNVTDAAVKASGREVRFGAVAYGSGQYFEATQNTPNLAAWVAASAAFPPFLTPQKINSDFWMDGGVRCVTPLQGAIDYGADVVDVILASPRGDEKAPVSGSLSAISVALRAIELQGDELFARDLKIADLINRLVAAGLASPGQRSVTVNVYEPTAPLLTGEFASLQFDPVKIRGMMDAGRQVAASH